QDIGIIVHNQLKVLIYPLSLISQQSLLETLSDQYAALMILIL
ncbi:11452_t:CDS:1, partial [Scutellospora calospora]